VSLIRAICPTRRSKCCRQAGLRDQAFGFTKATGVLELMTHEPFRGRRPFFIGDDVTDETVFAIMPISMASRFPSAGAPRASPDISMRRGRAGISRALLDDERDIVRR